MLLLGFGTGNFTFHHELDGVGGYNPLVTLQYLDFVQLVNEARPQPRSPLEGFVHDAVPAQVGSGLFDAASIRWVISPGPLKAPGFSLRRRYAPHPLTGRPVLLYENDHALPRAYLAYRTSRVDGPEEIGRRLASGFDGRRLTLFEGDALPLDGPAEITSVEPLRLRPETLTFEVAPEQPALLVVTDAWYPGWHARVDGVEAPVLRANAHFRGVPVPAGARRVELRFEPLTYRAGLTVSLAAAIVLGLLSAFPTRWRGRRRAAPEG